MPDAKRSFIHCGFPLNRTSIGGSTFAIDAANKQLEVVFQAENRDPIRRLGFLYGLRTGTPPLHKIQLQGVDLTTGNPDGTIKGGGTPASGNFTPPADTTWNNTWRWVTLDNPYTPANRGEYLSWVITYVSDTGGNAVGASHNSSFQHVDAGGWSAGVEGLPYGITNTGGARAKNTSRPVFGYGDTATVLGNPIQSCSSFTAITSASTPDEYAARFLLPRAWGAAATIPYIAVPCSVAVAARSLKVQLYQGTTPIQSFTADGDVIQAVNAYRLHCWWATEANLVPIRTGVEYRLGLQPQETTSGWIFSKAVQASNAEWQPYTLGTDLYLSSRTDLGAWSDDATARLMCMIGIGDLIPPAGGLVMAGG
jgi:hypothetical protein